jgi:hypothetical protein
MVFGLPDRYVNWGFLHMNWQHKLLKFWKSYTVGDSVTKYFLSSEIVCPTQALRTWSWKFHDRTSSEESDSQHSSSQNVCYVMPRRWTRPSTSQSGSSLVVTSNLYCWESEFPLQDLSDPFTPTAVLFFLSPTLSQKQRIPLPNIKVYESRSELLAMKQIPSI